MAKPRKPKAKPASVVPTTKAPEVEALAADLIERHHHGLRAAVVKYGFTTKKSGKRFGRVVLVREEHQTLMERKVCFLVIVSKLYWDAYEKTPIRREAALDELLCSMSYDGMTPRIEKIDFKGYRKNILRYGVQTDELAEAFKGFQLTLPNVEDVERELAEPEPPARCRDCGELTDGTRTGQEGEALCEACYQFMAGLLVPERSNGDDAGQHCEGGCGKFLRAEALQEVGDRWMCWACREEAADESAAANGEPSVQELDAEAASGRQPSGLLLFGRAPGDIGPDELDAMQGVDFTEHAAAVGGGAE